MKKSTLIVFITALSITACISGCGKQGMEPVMAATIETLTSEVTTEEESVVVTEEETESVEESSTIDDNLGVDGEFADGEYNELDETDIDITANISVTTDSKTVIIDGVEYLDISGDDLTEDEIKAMLGDDYVTPTGGDTTPLPPELGPNGGDEGFIGAQFSGENAPKGHHIQ